MTTIKVSLSLDDLRMIRTWYEWYERGLSRDMNTYPTDEDVALIESIDTILDGYMEVDK